MHKNEGEAGAWWGGGCDGCVCGWGGLQARADGEEGLYLNNHRSFTCLRAPACNLLTRKLVDTC